MGRALTTAMGIGCALVGSSGCSTVPVQDSGRVGLIGDIARREASAPAAGISGRDLASNPPTGTGRESAPDTANAGGKAARVAHQEDPVSDAWRRPRPRLSLRWPLDVVEVTSPFGRRKSEFHDGIDLRAKVGTPVRAAQSGVVVYAGSRIRGYGKMVVVRHAQGLATVYAHNSRLLVHSGDKVGQGQTLALSGMSGRASGPHLHFEVRSGIAAINPLEMLPRTATVDPALIRASGPIPARRRAPGMRTSHSGEAAGIAARPARRSRRRRRPIHSRSRRSRSVRHASPPSDAGAVARG